MKEKHVLLLGILSILFFITAPISVWADWTHRGSMYVYTSPTTLTPAIIVKFTHADTAVGVTYSGSAEYILSQCMNVSITGSFTSVQDLSSVTATVYERRYICTGNVTGSLGNGTIVGSNVEYYVNDILSGPSYNLTGTTFGRSDWECTISGTTHTGTTYYYYQPGSFSGGHIEGDIHGEYHFTGLDTSGHPLATAVITSKGGSPYSGSLNIVWDLPTNYIVETNTAHSGVNISYRNTASTVSLSGGTCNAAAVTVNHTGITFYLVDYNTGLYLGNWSDSSNSGKGAIYFYSNTPGTDDITPRVIGLSRTSASNILTLHQFSTGTVTYASSNTIASGRVISQSITAGSLINLGTPIDLVVTSTSSGVTVPNVVGMTQVIATSTLTSAGLVVGTVSKANSDSVPTGNVISQNPAAGTSVVAGSTVALTVSLGAGAEGNDSDTKDNKKISCFITSSSTDPFSPSGILLSLLGLVFICIPHIRRVVSGI